MCEKYKLLMITLVALLHTDAFAQRDSFQIESNLDAPIQRVWQAFTDAEDLKNWSVKLADVDLRVGGLIRTSYDAHAVLGDESTFETRILTYEPERMIAFQSVKTAKNLPARDAYLKIWTIVYFESLSKDQTRVRISSHGYGTSEDAQQMLAMFEKGNKSKLQRLNEYLQSPISAVTINRVEKNQKLIVSSQDKKIKNIAPLIHESDIDAPLAFVWDAFAKSKNMASWMAPLAQIDLRVGGKMLANYHADGKLGDENTIENTVLCFDPQRMISLKATKPPASFPFKDAIANTWSVMYFEEISPTQTRLRMVGMGYNTSEESQKMKQFFKVGNDWTLKELEKYLQTNPTGNTVIKNKNKNKNNNDTD